MSDVIAGEFGTIWIVLRKTGTLGSALPLDRCEDDVPDATAERTIGRCVSCHFRAASLSDASHLQPR